MNRKAARLFSLFHFLDLIDEFFNRAELLRRPHGPRDLPQLPRHPIESLQRGGGNDFIELMDGGVQFAKDHLDDLDGIKQQGDCGIEERFIELRLRALGCDRFAGRAVIAEQMHGMLMVNHQS